jgi:hypothetical protein
MQITNYEAIVRGVTKGQDGEKDVADTLYYPFESLREPTEFL